MCVRIGRAVFDDWVSLELVGGWTDTFIFRMSPAAGLPPADYAAVVRAVSREVRKLRSGASIWVQVCGCGLGERRQECAAENRVAPGDAPIPVGRWFPAEVRRALRGLRVPVAVTPCWERPQIWDFSYFPRLEPGPSVRPPWSAPLLNRRDYTPSELRCLRVLARADCAYTAEVASLAFLSRTGARNALNVLADNRLVALNRHGRYPLWQLRRPGLSVALRSWGLPPGFSFRRRRERGRDACEERLVLHPGKEIRVEKKVPVQFWARAEPFSGIRHSVAFERSVHNQAAGVKRRSGRGRHRRTARLWPAWLRKALPEAEIWSGWTEVTAGRVRPDALCWGFLDGQETLFWLEVESGHFSRAKLANRTVFRINEALFFARRASVPLVFALLGPQWACEALATRLENLPGDLAFLTTDWKAFGFLPPLVFGEVIDGALQWFNVQNGKRPLGV